MDGVSQEMELVPRIAWKHNVTYLAHQILGHSESCVVIEWPSHKMNSYTHG